MNLTLNALCASALIFVSGTAIATGCATESRDTVRPLLEVFTSEGCSSCPPADRWLSGKLGEVQAGYFSAIAWHVDYWDYLGWKDPWSIAAASPRQRWLAHHANAQVYTPGVFLNGRELRPWRTWSANSAKPQATNLLLKLSATPQAGRLKVIASTDNAPPDAALVIVNQRIGVATAVANGENAGVTLRHDFSAQEMVERAHTRAFQTSFALPTQPSALTAFVQAPDGRVLQSAQLLLPSCEPGG